MALSGVIYGTTSNDKIKCRIEWSASQSITNNTSNVYVNLYYYREDTYTTYGTINGAIYINGVKNNYSRYVEIDNENKNPITYASATVEHNANGAKSITISATGAISGTTLTSTNISSSITLDTINRYASISYAPNFNDEDNPSITYTNPAGNSATTLQACISLTGSTDDIKYRDIPKKGTTYTFNLTEAERNILRNATTGKSREVKFYIKTIIAGTTKLVNVKRTLYITNANPTITASVIDSNSKTIALTGDRKVLIHNQSIPQYTMAATANKGATIASLYTQSRDNKLTASTGTYNYCDGNSFHFFATDSRGFTSNKRITTQYINYIDLTCDLNVGIPTASGNTTVNISGSYFNGSFGKVSNTLTVQYRYAKKDASQTDWITISPTINNNAYEASVNVSGLDYQSSYTFQARAIDKLLTCQSANRVVNATPVFDWGANDMSINVPLSIQGRGFGEQKKIGFTTYLTDGIAFYTNIVDNPNGFVLVFSRADNGTALDEDFQLCYIPKYYAEIFEGNTITFRLASANYGYVATKGVKVFKDRIQGVSTNKASGTANGITYNNSKFIFRCIISL